MIDIILGIMWLGFGIFFVVTGKPLLIAIMFFAAGLLELKNGFKEKLIS